MFNSRAILGAMLGLAASLQIRESGGAHQVIRIDDRAAPMVRRQKRGLRYSPKKPPAGISGDKLWGKVGHIGMGMHSSGTRATRLNGKGGIVKTPVEKGPSRTLSVRDSKLTMAQGRRYKRMRPFERQRRLAVLFGMGA